MTLTRLFPLALVALAAGCSSQHSKADVERGKTALTAALDSWKNKQPPDRLKALPDPVEFSDELTRTHQLVEYTLGPPDARDPEVIRYATTLKLQDRRGKVEERPIVFMVALKSPIVIARDPYE